jgi:hypothetical protein
LDFRLLAEEIATTDDKALERIARLVTEEKITLSYSILPDKAFEYVLAELKRINKTVMERWGSEKSLLNGNRVILVGLPRFEAEES